jgi:uncharacterized protein
LSNDASLLWKLSAPETGLHSYLFGTMHVRDQRAFTGLDKVYACIDACQALALELDLDEGTGWSDPMLFRLPKGTPLHSLMPPKAYNRLRRILLKAFQVDIAYFPRLIPFALIEVITEQAMSDDHPFFLDAHLWAYAKEREKTLLGLETRQEQQDVLLDIPLDKQVKMLRDTGKNPARFRASLHRMAAWYEAGDLKSLYRASRQSAGNLRKPMLYDRNRLMAERMDELLRRQTVFCAVGAAHLWGGKGILRLLKQKGFSLKALPL